MADSESGDPILYLHAQFGKDILIGGENVSPELNSKTTPPGGEILLLVPILTGLSMTSLHV